MWWWLAAAWAAPGVQAQVFPAGIDKLTGAFEGTEYDFVREDIGAEVSCWDYIGVQDFNLNIPVNAIDVEPTSSGVAVELAFDEIRGEDMTLYAVDEQYNDWCFGFETAVYYVSIAQAEVRAVIAPVVTGDALTFAVVGEPEVVGDIDSDIATFPDDLALMFFEETLLAKVGEAMGERLPALLNDYVASPLLDGEFSGFDYEVRVVDASTSSEGIGVGASASVGWTGESSCGHGSASAQGRSPAIDFGDGDGASLAVGVTEQQLAKVFTDLWRDGYFCFSEQTVEELLAKVAPVFDPEIGGLGASVSLDGVPRITIDAEAMHVSLEGLVVRVTGELHGERVTILDLEADIEAQAEVTLNQDLAAFALSLADLELAFEHFEVRHLLSDSPNAEQHLRDFLQGWVADWIEREVSGIPLYASLFSFADWYLKVDRLRLEPGALALFIDLYAPGDPEIDLEAPETSVEVEVLGHDAVRLDFAADDSQDGPVAFAYAIDGGGWSSWATQRSIDETGLTPGDHTVAVKARDSWWNEDASPAMVSFRLVEPATLSEPEKKGCGCSASGSTGSAAWLAVVALAARRRRQSSSISASAR
jgi:MYXO-CTERM domain-containing protein